MGISHNKSATFKKSDQETSQTARIIRHLQNKMHLDNQTLLTKIDRLFLHRYTKQQKTVIYSLLKKWHESPLERIIFDEALCNQSTLHFYKDVQILSARVYSRIQQFIKSLGKKTFNDIALQRFVELLNAQNLEFSFDRFFWSKRVHKFSNRFNSIPDEKRAAQQKRLKCKLVNEVYAKAENNLLKKCFQFMIFIELASLSQNKNIGNRFMLNLERISTHQQRQLYLQSMNVPMLQDLINREEQSIIYKKYLPNYDYYYSKSHRSIQSLHCKYKDYQYLENRHDYIQLMFPNHYGSSFNSQSRPLNYIQSRLFNAQFNIGVKMLQSIIIFFDFLGINIDLYTLELKLISQKRLKNALLINTHNHLRIMRILACLSVVGFRNIALELIEFLDQHTQKNKILSKFRYKFDKNWKIYGDLPSKDTARSMCFLQASDFPNEHPIFKEIQRLNKDRLKQQTLKQPESQQSQQIVQQNKPQQPQEQKEPQEVNMENN